MTISFDDLDNFDDHAAVVDARPDTRTKYKCDKCRGTGQWSGGTNRLGNSKCLGCNGRGYYLTSNEQRAKIRATAAKRKIKNAQTARNVAVLDYTDVVGGPERFQAISQFLNAATWSDFYSSLRGQLQTRGNLSPKQTEAVLNGMVKAAERDATRAATAAKTSVSTDTTAIVEALTKALDAGLKRPVLRAGEFAFSIAPATGRNAGFFYVKFDSEYAGKISPEGRFFPIRQYADDEAFDAKLLAVMLDPKGAAIAHGRDTGQCACCGRELTDPKSIEIGIGPICLGKWFG